MNTSPMRLVSSSTRAVAGLMAVLISATLLAAMGGIADRQHDEALLALAARSEPAQAVVAVPASNG